MVSRSSSVSLTSKTIKGSVAIGLGSFCLVLPPVSALRFHPIAMRGLFGAVAADRHAAPPARASACVVGEHQRAAVTFACLHIGEVFLADKSGERFPDRQ